jgi:TolB-like protein
MKQRNERDGPRAKLEQIELNLSTYKVLLHFPDYKDPLTIYFDKPARRFYFSLIALVVTEMKNLGKPGFIHIRKHEKILRLLDNALAGQCASKTIQGMWEKIRKAWHYRLPDLEKAVHFKVLGRDLIPPYEKGGQYRYQCSDTECDIWASLFSHDENNKWRFKFAVDSVSLSLDDVSLTFGDLRDSSAWQGFLKSLSSVEYLADADAIEVREKIKSRWLHRAAAVAVAIVIILMLGLSIRNLHSHTEPPSAKLKLPHKPSIVVLPFVNMSGDPDKDYLSDGITEELINAFARIEGLRVISQTTAFYFKKKNFDIKTIGKRLKVDTVLEGNLRTEGDRLLVSADLINVADDSHLWEGSYDCRIKDVCALEKKVSQAIVGTVKPQLLGKEHRQPS